NFCEQKRGERVGQKKLKCLENIKYHMFKEYCSFQCGKWNKKKVVITAQQLSNKELAAERCFGILLSPG
ncbi:hypothetical protein DBR06_SOUSAS110006, partial [Sousa chinensis]